MNSKNIILRSGPIARNVTMLGGNGLSNTSPRRARNTAPVSMTQLDGLLRQSVPCATVQMPIFRGV